MCRIAHVTAYFTVHEGKRPAIFRTRHATMLVLTKTFLYVSCSADIKIAVAFTAQYVHEVHVSNGVKVLSSKFHRFWLEILNKALYFFVLIISSMRPYCFASSAVR